MKNNYKEKELKEVSTNLFKEIIHTALNDFKKKGKKSLKDNIISNVVLVVKSTDLDKFHF